MQGFIILFLFFGVLFALRYVAYKNKLEKEQQQDFYKKINKASGTDNLTLDLKLQKKWSFTKSDHLGGVRYNFLLSNGLNVSVIKNFGSYGAKADEWEMAVIFNDDFYIPDFFDGEVVKGWLSDEQVEQYLEQLENIKTSVLLDYVMGIPKGVYSEK